MPFPTYFQFSLSSEGKSEFKQTSLVPIRCSLVFHLFNDSCCQKHSQLHSWHCIPAVLSASCRDAWPNLTGNYLSKNTPTKSHTLPVPSDQPSHWFQHGQGDKLWGGMQTAGSDRNRENTTWRSCGGAPWVGKVWCERGQTELWLREHSPCPLTRKISQEMFSFAVS